jgi:adenylate kinase
LGQEGFIFDGYPRNLNQAISLDKFLLAHGLKLDGVLNLELDEEEAVARIVRRGETSGRSDDNIETIKNRFKTYQAQTIPLLDYYRGKGLLIDINGRPAIPEVTEQIMKVLKK